MSTNNRFNVLDEVEPSDDFGSNVDKLKIGVEYLRQFKEAHEIVIDKRALKTALYIYKLTLTEDRKQCLTAIDYISLGDLFVPIIEYCGDYAKQFVDENEFLNEPRLSPPGSVYKNLKVKYHFVSYLIEVVCFYTEVSNQFRVRFHERKGTLALIDYVSDEKFVSDCLKFKYSQTDSAPVGLNLLESFIRTVYHLSKIADSVKNDWDEMNASVKLMKFSASICRYSYLRIISYMTLANIFRDEDIEMLSDTMLVVKDIIKIVKIGAEAIVSKKDLKRSRVDLKSRTNLNEASSSNTEATVIVYNENRYNLIELLEALYKISINDKMKYTLYQDFDMKKTLKDIIMHGNEFEKEFSTKLLYQLCFDSNVCARMGEDDELVNYLCDREKAGTSNDLLRKNIFGILWLNSRFKPKKNLIESESESTSSVIGTRKLSTEIKKIKSDSEFNKEKRNRSKSKKETKRVKKPIIENSGKKSTSVEDKTKVEYRSPLHSANIQKDDLFSVIVQQPLPSIKRSPSLIIPKTDHIMISYNKESRDLCLKIKTALEKDGHKIWIDVEDIHGSSLESMALAIERSKCVLICMTEKYKQSPNCRAEAEYAFNLRKPIVPLIMQKNYVPDGWLGIILGAKIFINFSKYEFDECMRKLKIEIKNAVVSNSSTDKENQNDLSKQTVTTLKRQVSKEKITKISNWTNDDVKNWLKEKNVNSVIAQELADFNGELMVKLHEIIQSSPNFFLDKFNKNVDLFSLTKFMSDFEKLFYQ